MAQDGEVDANAIAKSMGKLKIETWRIDRVIPYDKNPRKIGPEAVAKVAGSIQRFGFNAPIGVDEDGVILYGHTRRQAAIHLGLKVVPIVVIAGLSEAKKREFRIADNRVAEESDWDRGLLSKELEELQKAGADLMATGFDADELSKLVDGLSLEMPPEAAPVTAEKTEKAQKAAAAAKTDAGTQNPTSVIDVGGDYVKLCAQVMAWYSPAGGVVLSPFAGIEGCAAAAANLGLELHDTPIDQLPKPVIADLIFGVPAPPSGDFPGWCTEYARVLDLAAARLKPGRFAVIFIGDARNEAGACYGLPWLTVEYGMRAGLQLHDAAVVLLPAGGSTAFAETRQLFPSHGNLFVFVKGDPKVAAQAITGP